MMRRKNYLSITIIFLSLFVIIKPAKSNGNLPDFPESAVVKILVYNGIQSKKMNYYDPLLINFEPSCGHGSGILFDKNGIILTSKHVVESTRAVFVYMQDNPKPFSAEVIYKSENSDFALLKLDGLDKTRNEIEFSVSGKISGDAPEKREEVWAYGYPQDMFEEYPLITKGIVARTSSKLNHWFQADATIAPGSSGGPIVNKSGAILGINTAGSPISLLFYYLPIYAIKKRN